MADDKKDYMERDKFFFASPKLFPNWPYKSRLAIGLSLRDFWAKKKEYYNFIVKKDQDHMYQISNFKARFFGMRYRLAYGTLPNIVPLKEFKRIPLNNPIQEDKMTIPEQIQISLL